MARSMDVSGLAPIEQTALLTEYCRALDSRTAHPILADSMARATVESIDYDFTRLAAGPAVFALVSLRAKMLDQRVREFIIEHPDGVVVDLGAGLSSAVYRVDPPPSIDWFSVDRPAVISLRRTLLPHRANSHAVATSLLEASWVSAIPVGRPAIAVADGLFPFLREDQIRSIVDDVINHFPSGRIAFSDYGTVTKVNRWIGKMATRRKTNSPHQLWAWRGFRDARYPETWNAALRLTEEASAFKQPEAHHFPPGLRLSSRLAHHVPSIARKARILQYEF